MHSSQRFLYSFVVNVANYPSNWVVMSDRSVGDLRFFEGWIVNVRCVCVCTFFCSELFWCVAFCVAKSLSLQ